jgi:hypothetical protein
MNFYSLGLLKKVKMENISHIVARVAERDLILKDVDQDEYEKLKGILQQAADQSVDYTEEPEDTEGSEIEETESSGEIESEVSRKKLEDMMNTVLTTSPTNETYEEVVEREVNMDIVFDKLMEHAARDQVTAQEPGSTTETEVGTSDILTGSLPTEIDTISTSLGSNEGSLYTPTMSTDRERAMSTGS